MREEMSVKGKAFMAIAALAAAAGLVVTGAASAGGGGADTKVTIKAPGGDVFGKVKSSKPNKCANGRTVKVYRQKGGAQGGGDDIKIGSDIAQANGPNYEWNIGQPGVSGKKIYARAGKIRGCKADNSKTIRAGSTS
jgi:hypothetical protein